MRALGADLPGLTRKSFERRPYPPGQHGQARKKISEYKLRLIEKQKLRMNYGLGERQLRNLMIESSRSKGSPGLRLLELLERRLDNVVFRAGFARTIPAARQLICHGFVQIAGKRVDIPSYRVRPGETLSLIESARANVHVKAAIDDTTLARPGWLDVDPAAGVARVTSVPDRDSVLVAVDIQKVVEYYAVSL